MLADRLFATGSTAAGNAVEYKALQCGNRPHLVTFNTQVGLLAAQSVSLGAGVNPMLEIRRVAPIPAVVASGKIAIMDVNVVLVLSLRALVQGQVTVSQVVNMTAGDQYQVFYNPAGLTLNIRLDNTAFSVVYLGTP